MMSRQNEESSSEEITLVKVSQTKQKPIKTIKTNNLIEIISSDEEESEIRNPVTTRNSSQVSASTSLVETPRPKRAKPNSPLVNKPNRPSENNQGSILNYLVKKPTAEIPGIFPTLPISGTITNIESVIMEGNVIVEEKIVIVEENVIVEDNPVLGKPLNLEENVIIEEPAIKTEPVVEEIKTDPVEEIKTDPVEEIKTDLVEEIKTDLVEEIKTPLTKQQIAAEKKRKAQLLREEKAREKEIKAAQLRAEKLRVHAERQERLRLEKLRLQQQRLEKAQADQLRYERRREEQLKAEQERMKNEQLKAEQERLKNEQIQREKLEMEKEANLLKSKLDAEKAKLDEEKAIADGKIKIIIRDQDEEYVHYLTEDDTLEDILEEREITKVKYNGIPVSKYLSLEEIGFEKENPYFEVVEEGNSDLTLKVNVDFFEVKSIKIGKNRKVEEIFEKCNKTGIIVMNGIIIDIEKKIKDVFENNDVIDVVKL